MRESIESLLGAAGYRAETYASAEALLDAGALHGVRCVVSDVRLGAMSGLELLSALRRRGEAVPFIVITAHDSPAMRDDALRRGASAYLAKPFAGAALLDAVAASRPTS